MLSQWDSSQAEQSPEVQQLIQELGIDVDYERPLVWIIEVGLQSPLPPKYEVTQDPDSGFTYYIDNDTQQSQWTNPLLPYVQQVVDIARMYMENPYQYVITEQVDARRREELLCLSGLFAAFSVWNQFREQLTHWHGPYIAEGRQYFVNSQTSVSSWEDPRIEAQYLCELQSALIQKLQTVVPPQDDWEEGYDEEGYRPATPDFAGFGNLDQSPSWGRHGGMGGIHGGDGAGENPYGATPGFGNMDLGGDEEWPEESEGREASPARSPEAQTGLAQLRAALAGKLAGIDFRGEAERDRVKLVKSMTDGINLVYDLLEEEKEMQHLQMERKKRQMIISDDDDLNSADRSVDRTGGIKSASRTLDSGARKTLMPPPGAAGGGEPPQPSPKGKRSVKGKKFMLNDMSLDTDAAVASPPSPSGPKPLPSPMGKPSFSLFPGGRDSVKGKKKK